MAPAFGIRIEKAEPGNAGPVIGAFLKDFGLVCGAMTGALLFFGVVFDAPQPIQQEHDALVLQVPTGE